MHVEHEARAIVPLPGIDGMSAPIESVTPVSGALLRASISLTTQSYCSGSLACLQATSALARACA
jgi:hypothetical protein